MNRITLIPLLLTATLACAESPVLEEIVVTATRSEKTVRLNPYSISFIDTEEIRRFSQDQLADLVADLPGVYVSDAGQAGQKRLRIRGEEARRMALLIDGQEFMDHREVGVPLLVDATRIQRVELVRGPASVLYGSKAMGGVINVITEKPVNDPFTADLSFTLNSATEGHILSTQLYGMAGGVHWNLGGFSNDQGLRDTPEGDIENTAYTSDGSNLGLAFATGDHEWRASFERFRSDSDVFVEPEIRFTPPLVDFAIDIPRRDREKTRFDYRYVPATGIFQSLTLDAYHQKSDREFNTFLLMALAPGLNTDTRILTTSDLSTDGVNLQTDWQPTAEISVIAGAQWMRDDVNQIRDREVLTNGISTERQIHTDSAELTTAAIYLQADANLTERLSLLVGLRGYDVDSRHQQSNHFSLLPRNNDTHSIGSVAMIYSPSESSALRFAWSEGYIYPSLMNLAVGAYAGSRFINPVATLQPESSDTFEIGYRLGNDVLAVDTVIFHTRAKNFIDHVTCSADDNCPGRRDKIYRNIGESNSHGLELSASYQRGGLQYDAGITWMQREKIYEDVDTWRSGIPGVTGHLSTTYSRELWARPLAIKVTGRFESDAAELIATRRGSTLELHPGYGVIDLAFDYQPVDAMHLGLVIANLGDKKYHGATENVLAAGRHARLKLSLTY